jgi:hypothetical protein
MHNSDGAGNGLSYSFAMLFAIGLWALLGGVMLYATLRGVVPAGGRLAALLLIPASGTAAVTAINLIRIRAGGGVPLLVLVLAPALIAAYAVWALVPSVRSLAGPRAATVVVWGGVALLTLLPWLLRWAGVAGRKPA